MIKYIIHYMLGSYGWGGPAVGIAVVPRRDMVETKKQLQDTKQRMPEPN